MIKIYSNPDQGFSKHIYLRRQINSLFKLICCCLLLLLPALANAQTTISGSVKDKDGPVIGATVIQKGVKNTTTTDVNGKFKITLKGSSTVLVVSYVGYRPQEVSISGSSDVTITLQEDLNKLNEVVVVGYGTVKKGNITGSVSSIKSDDLTLGGTTTNIGQAIQGKAAGVQVQQTSFAPGSGINITVRGGNSINTSTSPLYVVDGFISDNGNQVNPNDVEDIQVLKDASATAIYGARGGNGVVLITTKKGKNGKVSLDADISGGTQYLTYKPDLLTGQQYTDIQNATALEDGKPQPYPSSFQVANTNWLKLATRNATVQNQSISLSSGDQNSKIYVAGNHIKQVGVLQHTGYERYTARIGAEKTMNENLKISANFYGASSSSTLQSYSGDITAPLFSLLTAPPNVKPYNADGTYNYYVTQGTKTNALAGLLEPTNNSGNKLVNANIGLDYKIINGLTYHLTAGTEYSQTTAGQYLPTTTIAGAKQGGVATEQSSSAFRWIVENYFTYKFNIAKDHDFTVLLGTSNQKDVTEGLSAGAKGFSTDAFLYYNLGAGSLVNGYGSSKAEAMLTSYFTRFNYAYKDKLLASFSYRDDRSSNFGSNKRSGFFPAGAIAYKLTDDDFIKDLNTFSNLKARVSYGVTGNDRIPASLYLSTFGPYGVVLNETGNLQTGIEPKTLANPNLKWESTRQFDVGLDMGFANGRINASIDYYSKKTTDLLIQIPIGQQWGFSNQYVNGGAIQNRGIELSVNTNNVRGKDLSWNSTVTFAYNKQKALDLGPGVTVISTNTANPSGTVSGQEFTRVVPGIELGELYGYVYEGVVKTGEKYAPQPNSKAGDPKYKDVNGDGVITPADRTYLGNSNPHYMAGFGNDFHYKGIDLGIFFQGAFDYYLYNMNAMVLESTTGAAALNRFVVGKNENTPIPREGYYLSTYGSYVNSRFVENASYVRLKSLTLAYNFPASLFQHLKILQGIRVYAEAQNLWTITGYKGTDPEVNVHSGATGGGLDFNSFPAFRTITFGIKASIH
ncbi:TonB-dependent receptor [Mucilaginibacter rubeus]|uniref:TonB-dependent receptor n=1 Tax=Mucilaginibacter rubeus TaxID=2027860 RepID=A0AAE6JF71_9SPHI|nr:MULTISPECIES: TonB-dependent receptor [Mucilaginibacter]QEM04450.1 TonB-dependent receptor [Mucilaginibacter rubeus]QEM17046.1 TonB-dependent receptor [Mucilaginibacter gossypii]QTE46456.1 TonB-dependent receptor [Mucilaginibacter rubeus]QTE53053.1 TonB-dependent receptor [Mucilaginibacter rubeus]QTE58140.1 TonB-dependent receptor [Mucilaginibacter rubeus]